MSNLADMITAATVQNEATVGPFDHIHTPDIRAALNSEIGTSEYLIERERTARVYEGDALAGTLRCDGCHTISPRARAHKVEGVGHCCGDCRDLAASPYRPARWGAQPHEVR